MSLRPIKPEYQFRNFIKPKYLGSWCLVAIFYLISRLPYGAKLALGRWLGKLAHKHSHSRRKVTEANIRACFPELSEKEQQELALASTISNVTGYMESTIAWWGNPKPFIDSLEVHGHEHLEEAISRGKGVILIGAHFSLIDFAGPLVHSIEPFNYMYRPQNNPLMNAIVERARRYYSGRDFTKREIRKMIEFVREGNVVWYAPDQDTAPQHCVFAPFFGVQTACLTTPAWLARETGATVLQLSQFRKAPGIYSVHYSPILEGFPSDDEVENARRLNEGLEKAIRLHPEQYLWAHRRFKRRPPGEEPFYN